MERWGIDIKIRLTKITALILIVAIVASLLAAVAISYHAATNINKPTPTPTPTTMPSPQTTTQPTNPVSTPTSTLTPTPTQSPTQEKVRDNIMQYIKTNHPETAQFIRDLIWSGGEVPLNLVGSSTYSYYSNGWNLTMTYPVLPNPIYKVIADYSAPHIGIPYRVIWEGTWQDETIKENNYTFAQ